VGAAEATPPPAWPSLADVLGHAETVARLRGRLAAGRLGHALLLTGPGQVGATTICLALAGELLPRAAWPGGLATHPDLWLEDSEEESIRIDRVRAGREPGSLQEFLSLRPYAGGVRVAILARADRLTEQAANSLLKSIEEPPPRSHLLLTAVTAEALPATIVSRCQRAILSPVSTGEIDAWLRRRHAVPAAAAAEAAELAAGRPGRALRLAGDPAAREQELALLDRFLAACRGDGTAVLAAARELAPPAGAEGRERLLLCLSIWASFVRDAAAAAAGAPELTHRRSRAAELDRWALTVPADRAGRVLDRLIAAVPAVAANAHPRLLLEVLLLDVLAAIGPRSGPD
jgi:DNA polymerase-3 subunit delta'